MRHNLCTEMQNVHGIGRNSCMQGIKNAGSKLVIGIEEKDVFPIRVLDAGFSRKVQSPVFPVAHYRKSIVLRCIFFGDNERAIRTCIVNNHNLIIAKFLILHALQT